MNEQPTIADMLGYTDDEWREKFKRYMEELTEILAQGSHMETAKKLVAWIQEGDSLEKAIVISKAFELFGMMTMSAITRAADMYPIIVIKGGDRDA